MQTVFDTPSTLPVYFCRVYHPERGFLLPIERCVDDTPSPRQFLAYNALSLRKKSQRAGRCLGSQSERRHKVHSCEVRTHDRCFSMYQSQRFKVFSEYHRNARVSKDNLSKPCQSQSPSRKSEKTAEVNTVYPKRGQFLKVLPQQGWEQQGHHLVRVQLQQSL